MPSRAAAEQCRRTFEQRLLIEGWLPPRALQQALDHSVEGSSSQALLLPRLVTREALYDEWYRHSGAMAPRLPLMTREVIMGASARAASSVQAAPFGLRPGLIAEMVRLHDQLDRLGHDGAPWLRSAIDELAEEAGVDGGAARLLVQTRFLSRAFEEYGARVGAAAGLDERQLRGVLHACARPWSPPHLVVTVGDHHADPAGLWPADLTLLAHASGLQRVDVVATRRQVADGMFDRLRRWFTAAKDVVIGRQRPMETQLEVAGGLGEPFLTRSSGRLWIAARDRDEELIAFARRVKVRRTADPSGTAFIYRRPLPYLYAAQHVLDASGIPYQTAETLPLAAEPWSSSLDLLIDCALSDFTRAALVTLLRSPHVRIALPDGRAVGHEEIAAFDYALARDRYLGSLERFDELRAAWRRGHSASEHRDRETAILVAGAVRPLLGLLEPLDLAAPGASHVEALVRGWAACEHPPSAEDPQAGRTRRTRAAVASVLEMLRRTLDAHDRSPVPARDTMVAVRRWIEERTFALDRRVDGVHLVDAEAARYGTFDHVRIAGLIEGEWPEPSTRDIFYPAFMLARVGWPDERTRAAALRGRFADLLTLPAISCGVSVPELDQDAVVQPSSMLDELQVFGLAQRLPIPADESVLPVTREDALLATPAVPEAPALDAQTRVWASWRLARPARTGIGSTTPAVGERYSVTAVERYLQCPFQYFASRVLGLREEAEDETGLPSRDAGVFVHDVLHACFDRWHATGRMAITPADLPAARAVFSEVAEHALLRLAPGDRPLERVRLFGSSVSAGLLEKVLRTEAESFGDVVRRVLEHDIDGTFDFPAGDRTRAVHVRGRVDRVDWTDRGTIRVIDYKTGRRPSQAVQPGVYAHCVVQQDHAIADRGSRIPARLHSPAGIAPSGFIALREEPAWYEAVRSAADADAQSATFVEAVEAIEAGEFPVRPVNPFRCQFCEYPSVCRKDYVGDE